MPHDVNKHWTQYPRDQQEFARAEELEEQIKRNSLLPKAIEIVPNTVKNVLAPIKLIEANTPSEPKITVDAPEKLQEQMNSIDARLDTLTDLLKDSQEKLERAKNSDIDTLFRNRCQRRRKEGFCRFTEKGKTARGSQAHLRD